MGFIDKQTDLIGESYKNYLTMTEPTFIGKNISLHEYIHWIKTDEKYSEKWGLKIEERELSLEERYNLIEEDKHTQFVNWQSLGTDRVKEVLDEKNIPTRAITITYNNETIESYE